MFNTGQNSKIYKSFVGNSMQLAGDGTKPENGGRGYSGVWLMRI